ncbi:putative quinol monooxygenase [Bacillus sp. DJP31]|uniref:putative quinol monooxygenase n=1 Tax=Bacillus sp. DJP31 TaxID=3409789 RepID=UPI003BB6F6F9
MTKFGLYGKILAKEGERDALVDILLDAASSLQELEDCELYIVNVSDTEPNTVWVYEVWSDQNAHQASLTLESTQTLIKRAKPIIAGMERMNMLVPRGGKGIS